MYFCGVDLKISKSWCGRLSDFIVLFGLVVDFLVIFIFIKLMKFCGWRIFGLLRFRYWEVVIFVRIMWIKILIIIWLSIFMMMVWSCFLMVVWWLDVGMICLVLFMVVKGWWLLVFLVICLVKYVCLVVKSKVVERLYGCIYNWKRIFIVWNGLILLMWLLIINFIMKCFGVLR